MNDKIIEFLKKSCKNKKILKKEKEFGAEKEWREWDKREG